MKRLEEGMAGQGVPSFAFMRDGYHDSIQHK